MKSEQYGRRHAEHSMRMPRSVFTSPRDYSPCAAGVAMRYKRDERDCSPEQHSRSRSAIASMNATEQDSKPKLPVQSCQSPGPKRCVEGLNPCLPVHQFRHKIPLFPPTLFTFLGVVWMEGVNSDNRQRSKITMKMGGRIENPDNWQKQNLIMTLQIHIN